MVESTHNPKRPNIVLVLIDSLNRHYLSAYGSTPIATPNLSALARRAWRMDNHFVGSLPCMPARREIFSGFKEMMWRPWGPLEPFDARGPRLLEAAGYTTAIVTDHYHYWEEAANGYLQSFQGAELVRGHEIDFWHPPLPASEPIPAWVQNIEHWRPGWGRRYYANVKDFLDETDYFPARVMTGGMRWLNRHARQSTPFFLQIESFDVHGPFDVPEPYASMYGNGADRNRFTLWPPYQDVDRLAQFNAKTSPAELDFIRSQYAGKLTMVDRWFGEILKTFDTLSLWDNTILIVTTDHGHDLGERGTFGKQYPHYDSHANIPLFIWHPDYPGNGRSLAALTATVDIFATVLDAAGSSVPDRTHSRSLLPLVSGAASSQRSALLYGTFGQGVCCTDGEWTIFKSPVSDTPLFYYSSQQYRSLVAEEELQMPAEQGLYIPGVAFPQWKVSTRYRTLSRTDFLFHRSEDPKQQQNRWDTDPRQRKRMLDLLRTQLEQEQLPEEQRVRLGLPT